MQKKSGYLTDLFWRYDWLKNLAIWLTENIMPYILGEKIFPKMRFQQEDSKWYKFSV